jgi:hypothetical protein
MTTIFYHTVSTVRLNYKGQKVRLFEEIGSSLLIVTVKDTVWPNCRNLARKAQQSRGGTYSAGIAVPTNL